MGTWCCSPSTRKARGARTHGFFPALNIREDAEAFHLKFELPGVAKGDVSVEVTGEVLRVTGEKKPDPPGEPGMEEHFESGYGRFRREISLSDRVDKEAISSGFENGVLTVRVGKSEKGRYRKDVEVL